jgi:hypothetical protein
MMKLLFFFILPLVLCTVQLNAAEETPACSQIIEYIFDNFTEAGELKQDDRGFVYVDLDDQYVYKLNEFIKDQGFEIPPYFGPNMYGAHISVVYSKESEKYQLGEIAEVGSTIYFRPVGCKTVPPGSWADVEEVYVITVDAPILDKIRKKYGLPKSTYDFHITIGVKYKEKSAA